MFTLNDGQLYVEQDGKHYPVCVIGEDRIITQRQLASTEVIISGKGKLGITGAQLTMDEVIAKFAITGTNPYLALDCSIDAEGNIVKSDGMPLDEPGNEPGEEDEDANPGENEDAGGGKEPDSENKGAEPGGNADEGRDGKETAKEASADKSKKAEPAKEPKKK
jgi:hypothetical protein